MELRDHLHRLTLLVVLPRSTSFFLLFFDSISFNVRVGRHLDAGTTFILYLKD